MIRYIRLLGAALGGLIGLALAAIGRGLFEQSPTAAALLAAWVVAWVVVGFAILPYLTVVPADWLDPPGRSSSRPASSSPPSPACSSAC